MTSIFISSTGNEKRAMHSKNNNAEIMIVEDLDEII